MAHRGLNVDGRLFVAQKSQVEILIVVTETASRWGANGRASPRDPEGRKTRLRRAEPLHRAIEALQQSRGRDVTFERARTLPRRTGIADT